MKKQLNFCLIMAMFVVMLAACGGDQPAPVALTIHAQDIKFDVNTLTVKAGQPVALTYINEGKIDHAFTINGLVPEQKVRPGATHVFKFTAKEPGSYHYLCAIPGHEMAGMAGELIVEP